MSFDMDPTRPIWPVEGEAAVRVIDQRRLPHALEILTLTTVDEVVHAIQSMVVRGAPLIGVTGAYGVMLALHNAANAADFLHQCERIRTARPTAVNLAWGVARMLAQIPAAGSQAEKVLAARRAADAIAQAEVDNCRLIGEHGAQLVRQIASAGNGRRVNLLTHCNAGWLACVEYGTATAPIYVAHEQGVDLHVWVDETRPLNQGARLTAWELGRAGVPHTVIADNTGGHLMQHAMVDIVIVGTDRTTANGDVANKIGTYLKALAARDNDIPFYVALPSSTFDWDLTDGLTQIPIEQRDPNEVRYVQGLGEQGVTQVLVPPADSPAADFAFDVTPARLVTGFITERGVCAADPVAIGTLFPEKYRTSSV